MTSANFSSKIDSGLGAHRAVIIALILLLFALRLAYVIHSERIPFIDNNAGDSRPYRERAAEIRGGDLLGREVFFDAPLFPYFLAVFGAVPGGPELPARVAHAFLGTASILLVFLLTRSFFGAGPALLASILYGLYGFALFYDALLLKPTLATFLLLLAAWWLRTGRSLSSGFVLGLSFLMRGNFLVLLPAFLYDIYRRRSAKTAGALLLAAAVPVLATTARNAWVGHDFVPLTYHAGPTFFHGNNPNARGTYSPIVTGRQNPPYEKEDAIRIAEEESGRPLKPSEINRFWFRRAAGFIAGDPGRFVALTIRRAHYFWNGKEIPDSYDFRLFRGLFPELRVAAVTFGLVAPLAVLGWFYPRRLRGAERFLPGAVLLFFLSLVFLFVFGRYRLPVVPFFAPTAGRFLWHWGTKFSRRRWKEARALALPAAIAMTLANAGGFEAGPETGLYNLGIRLESLGLPAEAEVSYRKAVDANPAFASGWNNLGGVLLQGGRKAEAKECFRKAIESDPGHRLAIRNLALLCREEGDLEEARGLLVRAVGAEGNVADLVDLGAIEEMTGREGDAIARYEEALRAEPENPEAAANLGRLLAGSGRFEDALPLLHLGAAGLPETSVPQVWLALALVETGSAGEAEGVLGRAAATGMDPRIPLLWARIRLLRGDRTGAFTALGEARSAGLPPEPALRLFLGEEELIGRALAP